MTARLAFAPARTRASASTTPTDLQRHQGDVQPLEGLDLADAVAEESSRRRPTSAWPPAVPSTARKGLSASAPSTGSAGSARHPAPAAARSDAAGP